MKNEKSESNFLKINKEEGKAKTITLLSKKRLLTRDLAFEEFEDGLNISDIENNEENIKFSKNSKNYENNNSFDFSDDLDKFNESESDSSIRKLSIESIQIDFRNQNDKDNDNDKNNKYKKKKTKEDLNNTPLPIFDCIYCTNEKIVFKNFSNNIIADKYLFLTSVYDMNDLSKIILNNASKGKYSQNQKLLNIIIKNTEYIKDYFPKEKNQNFFKSNIFKNLCEKYNSENIQKQKIENKFNNKKNGSCSKSLNNISKKGLFNYSKTQINNLNLNSVSELIEAVPQNIENNLKNNCINISSLNTFNINTLSLNNNEFFYHYNKKENNNNFNYIIENVENRDDIGKYDEDKEDIINFSNMDIERKISRTEIAWDKKYYDIYNPDISSDFEDNCEQDSQNVNFDDSMKFNIENNDINNNLICVNKKFLEKECNNSINLNFLENINNVNNIHFNNSLNFLKDTDINKTQGLYTSNTLVNKEIESFYLESFSPFINNNNSYINKSYGFLEQFNIIDNNFRNRNESFKYILNQQNSNVNNLSTNNSFDININSKKKTSLISNNLIYQRKNIPKKISFLNNKKIIFFKHRLPKKNAKNIIIKKNIKYNNYNNLNFRYKYINKDKFNYYGNKNNNYLKRKRKIKKNNKSRNKISKYQNKFLLKEKNRKIYNTSYNKSRFNNNIKINSNIMHNSNSSFFFNKGKSSNLLKENYIHKRNRFNNNSSFIHNNKIYSNNKYSIRKNKSNKLKKNYYFREKKKENKDFYFYLNNNIYYNIVYYDKVY